MTPEKVFTTKYVQLSSAIVSHNSDDWVNLPAILRQFLLDGDALIHQVNRQHRLDIRFKVGQSVRERCTEMEDLALPVPKVHLLQDFPPNIWRRELQLDGFLRFEVLKFGENYYSARQLINVCANKLGGVHYDPGAFKDEVVRDLADLGGFFEQYGGSSYQVLLLIGKIAHSGLWPLYTEIAQLPGLIMRR